MTFRPKLLADIPGGTPDVQIFFHGQLLMRSEDETSCEVAVNSIATNHVLTIEARTKTAGKPDLINMRHLGPLHFRQGEGMLIEVVPNVASPAAFGCRTFDTINYESGLGPPNNPPDEDFRWILNLEGPLFHERELNPAIFGSHQVIRLVGGEYFFQTAARASGQLEYVRSGGGKSDATLRRIGAIASASVFLGANQSVVLRWQDTTQELDRVLTLTRAQGVTYEIYISNTPLYEELDPQADLSHRDELIEYYKVVSEISRTPPPPDGPRFQLVPRIVPVAHPLETGSPSIPCQVINLNGPR
jgi:hypothetical protein